MSTQYRLVQSGKTASGGCRSRFVRAVAPRIIIYVDLLSIDVKSLETFPVSSSLDSHMMIYDSLVRYKLACACAVCNSLTNRLQQNLKYSENFTTLCHNIFFTDRHAYTCNYTLQEVKITHTIRDAVILMYYS
jgi:hypothetical protein